MIDYLVMLLSTDWFKPYWSVVGINVDEESKAGIQQGCRDIVREMMAETEDYHLIDFSEKRRQATQSKFLSLVRKTGAENAVSETLEEWANTSHDQLTAVWIYTILTRDLFSVDAADGRPNLEFSIRAAVMNAQEKYDLEPTDFLDICMESRSRWDVYTQKLTPDQPTVLADYLAAVLRERRLRALWSRVQQLLTPNQRADLVGWYHAMAKFRRHRDDLIPAYLS